MLSRTGPRMEPRGTPLAVYQPVGPFTTTLGSATEPLHHPEQCSPLHSIAGPEGCHKDRIKVLDKILKDNVCHLPFIQHVGELDAYMLSY